MAQVMPRPPPRPRKLTRVCHLPRQRELEGGEAHHHQPQPGHHSALPVTGKHRPSCQSRDVLRHVCHIRITGVVKVNQALISLSFRLEEVSTRGRGLVKTVTTPGVTPLTPAPVVSTTPSLWLRTPESVTMECWQITMNIMPRPLSPHRLTSCIFIGINV